MKATVADIVHIMETIAPISFAEEWDNSGLQVGESTWPTEKIWIALDPIPEVVEAACHNDVDLLITHHPLIFGTLKKIDFGSPVGNIIRQACMHKMAIYTAHTNLDNTTNGLNDILANKLGVIEAQPLRSSQQHELFKRSAGFSLSR